MNSNSETRQPSGEPVLSCRNLHKYYIQGPQKLHVLRGIDLAIGSGELVAIVGASGSGKSTLLNMLGGLDLPSEGEVSIGGEAMSGLSEQRRGELRNRSLGFVYQFHHLLPEFTALENVAMPLLIRGDSAASAAEQASEMLAQVGLAQRLRHKPSELSGGERQRVAIARALVARPRCVLMDEPTGNLDHKTAETIHLLIEQLNQQLAISFIIVTHDLQLADRLDRRLTLVDGELRPGQS